jgi:RNA polymerase sigma factor (TIGR02999 family)
MPPMPPGNEGNAGTITSLLRQAKGGDKVAADELFDLVYEHLKGLAKGQLSWDKGRKSGEATALVSAACEKLLEKRVFDSQNRRHFFFAFGRAMHDVLVEAARSDLAQKRGGGSQRVPLIDLCADGQTMSAEIFDVQQAIDELHQHDPEAAQIVVLRYFGGATLQESAQAMACTFAIARGHWDYARAWLRERLSRGESHT